LLSTIGLAIVLFVTTNVDDVFVLVGFFASPRFRARDIILGQYLGIAALVAVSVVASLISLVVAREHVGLLGVLPILLGLKQLLELWKGIQEEETDLQTPSVGNVLAVSGVTIANGGDNIGIYTPVFATQNLQQMLVILFVFAVMVGVWVAFARWLVHHPRLGAPLRRYGHLLIPFVLIAVGVFVLHEAGSFSLLFP